jgi:membrane protease YdiL (CAAX protease family)
VKREARPAGWPALLGYLAAFVLSLLASALVVTAVAWPHRQRGVAAVADEAARFATSAPGLMAVAAVDAAVLLGVAFAAARWSGGPIVRTLRLGPTRVRARAFAGALGGLLGLSFACGSAVDLLGAHGGGVMDILAGELHSLSLGSFVLALFAIAVAPAIAEETFFRGFMQNKLAAAWGRRTGLVVASAAFALIHLDPVQSAVAFFAGLFLGWAADRSGSIRPTMFAHAVNNALFIAIARFATGTTASRSTAAATLALGAAVCAGSIFVIVREAPSNEAR